jgi:hypothetical protein
MILLNKLALSRFDFHLLTMLLIFQCTFCVLAVKATAMAGFIQLEVRLPAIGICREVHLSGQRTWRLDDSGLPARPGMELEHCQALVPGELHIRGDAVDQLPVPSAAQCGHGHRPEEPDKLLHHFWRHRLLRQEVYDKCALMPWSCNSEP